MHSPATVAAHLGRRGAVLLLLGLTWAVQGIALLVDSWAPITLPTLQVIAPTGIRAAMWIAPGLIGVLGAVCKRWDPTAFVAIIAVPVFMAISWALAVILETPEGWHRLALWHLPVLGVMLVQVAQIVRRPWRCRLRWAAVATAVGWLALLVSAGDARSVTSTWTWAVVAGLVAVVAGWPEVPRPRRREGVR